MNNQQIVEALIHVRDHVLVSEEKFAQGRHFLNDVGKSLEVSFNSLERVSKHCIEGAVLIALWTQEKLGKDGNHFSRECRAVMCALADTLGLEGDVFTKVREVQKYSAREGFIATRILVQNTIERLNMRLRPKKARY